MFCLQYSHHELNMLIHDVLQTEQMSRINILIWWHTTNRTDIKKNILIDDILQTEQTSIKMFNSWCTTNCL